MGYLVGAIIGLIIFGIVFGIHRLILHKRNKNKPDNDSKVIK